ncbi:glucan endo-1,3-beta-glucosidase-like [Rhododendron vialii]|uniref:glucan endo-1,3-beta-glucosidase-like n=1 Tax=Rhododendron vialii TaxID=182163 RepID=UPI00265D8133|nr:glucan endo-1,3-beta-glucosidase-like [Rhododendron vialii]
MDKFKRKSTYPNLILLNISTLLLTLHITAVTSIGANYGTTADNLPPPAQVAQFIKTQTTIDRVKIFDMDPDIISAFANTNIPLTVTIANGDFPPLANLTAAQAWVASNIAPVYPKTTIEYILIGSEVLLWGDGTMFGTLVPAMNAVYNACVLAGFPDIKVTTAHSLGILNSSVPPSSASFLFGWQQYFLTPMLEYHRRSKSPFMVNPYPYFALNSNDTDFVLFEPNPGVFDPVTGMNYTNMYDLQLDAVYVSMKKLGFPDVDIAVGETGWPSAGDPGMVLCTVQNAQWYNLNVVKRAGSGVGTPLMPGRNFETFLFALFNEDQKTGGTIEKHWGLFYPNMTAVYDIGITRQAQPGGGGATPTPVTPTSGKQWCVPKKGATDTSLLANINWACTSGGEDCSAIKAGGACFNPNTVWSHAAYIMNAYYQAKGLQFFNCDFAGTGSVTTSDPSYGTCIYSA